MSFSAAIFKDSIRSPLPCPHCVVRCVCVLFRLSVRRQTPCTTVTATKGHRLFMLDRDERYCRANILRTHIRFSSVFLAAKLPLVPAPPGCGEPHKVQQSRNLGMTPPFFVCIFFFFFVVVCGWVLCGSLLEADPPGHRGGRG